MAQDCSCGGSPRRPNFNRAAKAGGASARLSFSGRMAEVLGRREIALPVKLTNPRTHKFQHAGFVARILNLQC